MSSLETDDHIVNHMVNTSTAKMTRTPHYPGSWVAEPVIDRHVRFDTYVDDGYDSMEEAVAVRAMISGVKRVSIFTTLETPPTVNPKINKGTTAAHGDAECSNADADSPEPELACGIKRKGTPDKPATKPKRVNKHFSSAARRKTRRIECPNSKSVDIKTQINEISESNTGQSQIHHSAPSTLDDFNAGFQTLDAAREIHPHHQSQAADKMHPERCPSISTFPSSTPAAVQRAQILVFKRWTSKTPDLELRCP